MRGVAAVVIVLLVVVAGSAGIYLLVRPAAGGTQVVYELQFPPGFAGDRKGVAQAAGQILQKRLALDLIRSVATASPEGRVFLRIPQMSVDRFSVFRESLEKRGDFGVHEVADAAIARGFRETRRVPDGFQVLRRSEGGPPADADDVLISREPVVKAGEIAELVGLSGTPQDVSYTVEVRAEAADRLARTRQALSGRDAPGTLAVVFDGQLVALAGVRAPFRHGQLEFTTRSDDSNRIRWSILIQSGRLPYPIASAKVESYRGRSLRP